MGEEGREVVRLLWEAALYFGRVSKASRAGDLPSRRGNGAGEQGREGAGEQGRRK